jgi:hypothetical protein
MSTGSFLSVRASSPMARRAALTRLVNADSPTNRLPQTASTRHL